jgi:hypothetical protein
MGNKFFKHHVDPEDPEYRLYRGLTNEVAEIFGIDFVFLKREIENPDHILGEDPSNKFDTNRLTTWYIENFQQFEGNGDLFGKFGFTIDDQLILVIGVDTFRTASGFETPFEGDLLYHPVSEKFFEIKHVARPQGFYQFGAGQMMFRITTVLFKYSHERFEFDSEGMIDDIDDFMNNIGNDSNTPDEADQAGEEASDILDFDESNIFGDK